MCYQFVIYVLLCHIVCFFLPKSLVFPIVLCHYYSPAYSHLVLVTTVIVSQPCLMSGLFPYPTTSCYLSTVCQ